MVYFDPEVLSKADLAIKLLIGSGLAQEPQDVGQFIKMLECLLGREEPL